MKRLYPRCLLLVLSMSFLTSCSFSIQFPDKNSLLAQPSLLQPVVSDKEPDLITGKVNYLPFLRGGQVSIFGAETFSLQQGGGMDDLMEAGALWMRRNAVMWDSVEPVQGARNWAVLRKLDRELQRAAQQGARVIMVVRKAPAWAQLYPGSHCGPIKRAAMKPFADFMYDLVDRYSHPPYNVRYWEVWNEPEVDLHYWDEAFGCMGDPADIHYGGAYYAEMLRLVYPRIKEANPNVKVLLGGLVLDCNPKEPPEIPPKSGQYRRCTSTPFLEGILKTIGSDYFDGISYHAYDYYGGQPGNYSNPYWHTAWNDKGPSLSAKVAHLRQVLDRYQVKGKFLMNTETALLCEAKCTREFEDTKANYLVQNYAIAASLGLRANNWYDIFGSWLNSGLLYHDGTRRPAYFAYKFFASEVGKLAYNSPVELPGIVGHEFLSRIYDTTTNGRNGRVWVVWSKDGRSRQITLPNTPQAIYDVFGNPQPLTIAPTLDYRVRIIVWNK